MSISETQLSQAAPETAPPPSALPGQCSAAVPSSSPQAAIPNPQSLLPSFLSLDCDLGALAEKHSLSSADLIAFATDPEVCDTLKRLKDFTSLCFSYRSLRARLTAVNTLERLTRAATDPIEQRRAASALVRATTTPGMRPSSAESRGLTARIPARPPGARAGVPLPTIGLP